MTKFRDGFFYLKLFGSVHANNVQVTRNLDDRDSVRQFSFEQDVLPQLSDDQDDILKDGLL